MLKVLGILLLLTCLSGAQGQSSRPDPYAKEIAAFKGADRAQIPTSDEILFIGSSSFTRWTDVGSYFPNHKILNRAFGGSTLLDVIHRINDVVYPYRPRQIVIYCGENDLAGDPSLPAYKVYDRFVELFGLIRAKLPKVPILYVSMKPSPSRWALRSKFIAANHWIQDYCESHPKSQFVSVWDAMLDSSGRPKPEIFGPDRLHMNAKGYQIWQPLIEADLR